MELDEATRQRAIDAAAAVAVAAAAAAHQTHEAAALRHQDAEYSSHQQQQQVHDKKMDSMKVLEERAMEDMNGYVQHPPPPASVAQGGDDAAQAGAKLEENPENYVHTSMHYSPSDAEAQEGDTSHLNDISSSSNRPTVHHTKRRKINTCLPCKRRKVKCDREKPYCGQCRKHNFPPAQCTWSTVIIDTATPVRQDDSTSSISTSAAVAEAAAAAVEGNTSGAATATPWYELSGAPWANFNPLPIDQQNTQTLLSRISELETALASKTAEERRDQEWNHEDKDAGLSQAQRGMAADALAIMAQHDPQAGANAFLPSDRSRYTTKRIFTSSSNVDPYAVLSRGAGGKARMTDIAGLLPDMITLQPLSGALAVLQEHGIDLGLHFDMINNQLTQMQGMAGRSDQERRSGLDLSFVALVFFLLAVSVELTPAFEAEKFGELLQPDLTQNLDESQRRAALKEVTEIWCAAGQAILSELAERDKASLNVLVAMSLERHYLRATGRVRAARALLLAAIIMCESTDLTEFTSQERQRKAIEGEDWSTGLGSTLATESFGRLSRHLIFQLHLEQKYSSLRVDFSRITERTGAVGTSDGTRDPAFEITLTLYKLVLESAAIDNSSPQTLELGTARLASNVNGCLEQNIQDPVDGRSAAKWPSVVIQIFLEYEKMSLQREASPGKSIDSAIRILELRRSLGEQALLRVAARKAMAIQQVQLEAAFTLAFALLENQEDNTEQPKTRKELEASLGSLCIDEYESCRAKDVLELFLQVQQMDRVAAGEHEVNILLDNLRAMGFAADHLLSVWLCGRFSGSVLARSTHANRELWRAIGRDGYRFLLPKSS